jgi:hypothetical protein
MYMICINEYIIKIIITLKYTIFTICTKGKKHNLRIISKLSKHIHKSFSKVNLSQVICQVHLMSLHGNRILISCCKHNLFGSSYINSL